MLSSINSFNSQKTNQNPNFKGVYLINLNNLSSVERIEDVASILRSLKSTGERIRFNLAPAKEDSFIACERGCL